MMMNQEPIVNRVAKSPLKSIDLEDYYPKGDEVIIDIADNLYNGMILREKDFREFVKNHNWQQYEKKFVALTCSVDAIVPTWAYMLLASKLKPYAQLVVYGGLQELHRNKWKLAIEKINLEEFKDAKVVVKGCGNLPEVEYGYVAFTQVITGIVSSMMYGEPCSTVPVYKRPKEKL